MTFLNPPIKVTHNLIYLLVGAIALVIGGVGIMNIMLVVVTERQAEIALEWLLVTTKQIILLFY